jgi:hypothetical protein
MNNLDTSQGLSNLFLYGSIIFILLLPFNIINYRRKEYYQNHYIDINTKSKGKYLSFLKKAIIIFRIELLLTPLFIFVVPLLLFLFGEVNIIYSILLMLLYEIYVILYYLRMSWIIEILLRNPHYMCDDNLKI